MRISTMALARNSGRSWKTRTSRRVPQEKRARSTGAVSTHQRLSGRVLRVSTSPESTSMKL